MSKVGYEVAALYLQNTVLLFFILIVWAFITTTEAELSYPKRISQEVKQH